MVRLLTTRAPCPAGQHSGRVSHHLTHTNWAARGARPVVRTRSAPPEAPAAPLPTTRPAAVAALADLLAVADDATRPQADAAAAEATAVALARRLAGLDERAAGGKEEEGEVGEATSTSYSPSSPSSPPLLRGFGRARQVPKRAYTLADLRLNKIEPDKLLSPTDATLDGVRGKLRTGALLATGGALALAHPTSPTPVIVAASLAAFAWTADAIGTGGAVSALALDAAGRVLAPSYGARVARHEAGHFLIAFLVGLLPKGYTLSSASAWAGAVRAQGLPAALTSITRPAAQAGTRLCDGEFAAEVAAGKLKASTVDAAVCVALAGVTAEYLAFGSAEGGLDDVSQLDGLLRALQFSQTKADSQVRWGVLNAAALLRRYEHAHTALAAAMESGASVGECIAVIESELDKMTDAEL